MNPRPILMGVALGLLLSVAESVGAVQRFPSTIRVYSHQLEPREHPDDDRRAVRPPDWGTFRHRTQFTTLRGFGVENGRIVGYAEELERFTRTFELGDVIWPSYPILFAENLGDLADEIERRNLYLFDIWGYVPGSGPGGYWQQFQPPAQAFATLESRLGERWLGTDIGEQDGRYIGGYAGQMTPASADRFEQYLNFQKHFERMSDDLGHKHSTLVSLNFGHHLLKEGTYALIGAETAQALPNSQVYYAFIRGAGKQYGVPWFGNASVYNRWGYKNYNASGGEGGDAHGPTKGSSLSLLKRLLYSHILYNSVAVGFENMWFEGDRLSPIGRIQQAAHRWVQKHGSPGIHHAPVALIMDFYGGWTFPRHLYTDTIFRVWGNLPYQEGDYLTDALLDRLYPGYADASYFHDEKGFLSATPYGDLADCLLSDAPLWLLERYPLLIAGGGRLGGLELRDKLAAYVQAGGHLVITAGNLANLPGGLGGVRAERRAPPPGRDAGGARHPVTYRSLAEAADIVPKLTAPPGIAAFPAVGSTGIGGYEVQLGQGLLTVLNTAFGLEPAEVLARAIRSEIDRSLPRPLTLSPTAAGRIDRAIRKQMLFAVSGDLTLITCRKAAGEYTLGIFNNTWGELPLQIRSYCGPIQSIEELPLDQSEKTAIGLTPENVDPSQLGQSTVATIAGGDVRIFAVRVKETNVVEIAHVKPPARPRGRFLWLRRPASIKESLLARSTFFEHFDGVVVDWSYLHERETAVLRAESAWLRRQGVRLAVDLSSGVNLYPDLRLIDNLSPDYERSRTALTALLMKMDVMGARDLILTLHRHPENNFTADQTEAGLEGTLRALAREAAARGATVHLRLAFGKPPWSLEAGLAWLDRVGADNLKLAPSSALLADRNPSTDLVSRLDGRLGFWLVAAPRRDRTGRLWDAHAPLAGGGDLETIRRWLAAAPGVPMVQDALVFGWDEEYLEARTLQELLDGALTPQDLP